MNNKQFQTESVAVTTRLQPNRLHLTDTAGNRIKLPAAQSVLLGLLLRGYFSELDREFLDHLAPTRSIAFVLQGEKWLHPRNICLFDPATLKAIRQFHPTAIFSHLCPPVPGSLQRHKITSGIINPGHDAPLMVGLLGPDHEISGADRENEFVEAITALREAYRCASRTVATLKNRHKSGDPVIVVNRASGRIVHVSNEAASLCSAAPDQIIDREFHDIHALLPSLTPGMKLALETVTEGDISLGLLRLGGMKSGQRRDEKRNRFLLEQADQALNLVRQSVSSQRGQTVVDPIGRLEYCLQSLRSVLIENEGSDRKSNLLICLDKAIKNLTGNNRHDYSFRIRTVGKEFSVACEPEALVRMIGSVLLAHLDKNTQLHDTELLVDTVKQPRLTVTTTASPKGGRMTLCDHWLVGLEQHPALSEVVHSSSTGGTKIQSKLTFKE